MDEVTAVRFVGEEGKAVVRAALRRAGVAECGEGASIVLVCSSERLAFHISAVRAEHPATHVIAVLASHVNARDAFIAGADDVALLEEVALAERIAVSLVRVGLRSGTSPASQHHSLMTFGLRATVEQEGLGAAARELVYIAGEMLRADRVVLSVLGIDGLRTMAMYNRDASTSAESVVLARADIDGWLPASGTRQIVTDAAGADRHLKELVKVNALAADARVIEHAVQRNPGEFIVVRVERDGAGLAWDEGDYSVSSFVFQTTMRMFTDAAQVREREEESERARRLEATLHSIGDAVIATDPQNRIVRMNPAACRLLGKTFESVRGTFCPDVLHLIDEASKQPLPDPTTEVLESGTTLVETAGPTFLECARGVLRPVALTASPIRDSEGAIIGCVVVFRDRTEELEIELALASVAANEAANKHRSAFLAMMNHEMRTPLNGVLGMTTVLLATVLTDEQREYAETVRTSGEQLLRLVDDILDFAKLEAQELSLANIQYDPLAVIDAVCTQMAEIAFNQGLEFGLLVAPNLPRACSGDPGRIRQVLGHLIDNAIKFTEIGEVTLSVTQEGSIDGVPYWRFTVTDTGIGVAEADLVSVFRAFEQADSSMSRRHGGSGIGLALVRQIVALMGGDDGVESELGVGSTFHVTIPMPAGTTRTEIDGRAAFRCEKSVLVLSAVKTVRQAVEVTLGAAGVKVTAVSSAEEAVDAVRSRSAEKFAMIFVDCGEASLNESGLRAIVEAVGSHDGTAMVGILPAGRKSPRVGGDLGCFGAVLVKPLQPARLVEVAQRMMQPAQALVTQSGRPRPLGARGGGAGRVLVVDDNAVNLRVCVRMLEKLGYRPETAIGGAEAVEAAQSNRYDLILMDCQMPVVDGYVATRRIRENEKKLGGHVAIVALTANTTNEDRERSFLSGMDDFVSKPITLEALDSLLERWIVITV